MGWNRQQYRKPERKVRHGRSSLHADWCQECGRELPMAHQVMHFGRWCRVCSQVGSAGGVEMASYSAMASNGKPFIKSAVSGCGRP